MSLAWREVVSVIGVNTVNGMLAISGVAPS
jgi:hypothetical protein